MIHIGSSHIIVACICNASSKQIGHGMVAGHVQQATGSGYLDLRHLNPLSPCHDYSVSLSSLLVAVDICG